MIILQWIRSVIFIAVMYLSMAVLALVFLPWALLSKEGAITAAHTYCRWVRFTARVICGLRSEVRGTPPTGEVVVAAKHQSFFDIIIIYSAMPRPRFIMKRELIYAPILGKYALRMGCIPVDRGKRGAAVLKMKQDVARGAADPGQLIIYPQGTRVAEGAGVPATGHVRLTITPRQIRNYSMAGCRRIICVSDAVGGLFAGSGLEERVRVVHNGIDVSRFLGVPRERVPIAETAAWQESALVVALLGLVSERKNQLLAAEAVALAAREGADVRLLLAGDAFKSSLGYGESVKARLAQADLAGRAVWVPFREDVAGLYGACDVNMLISTEEGFGRTIVEAGAAGRPSIGSANGGIPELIDDGESGWIVRDLSPAAVARVLVEAWRNREDVRRRGGSASERVRARFTIEACAARTVSVWREAVGG